MGAEEKNENEVVNTTPNEVGGADSTASVQEDTQVGQETSAQEGVQAEPATSVQEETQPEPVFRVEPPLRNTEEKASESAQEQSAAEAVQAVVGELEHTTEQVVPVVKETAEKVEEAVTQKVEQAVPVVKETAEKVEEAVTQKVEQAVPVVKETAEKAEEAVTQKVEQAAPVVQQTATEVKQAVQQAAVQAEQKVETVVEKAEEKISAADRIKENVNKYKPAKKQKTAIENGGDGKKSHSAVIIVIVILFMLLVLGLGYAFFQRRVKVDLDKYISVNFSGYEGYGEAEVKFDEEAFLKDYKKKIKVKKKKSGLTDEILDDYTAEEFLYDYYISGAWELDGENGKYKNGDKVHLTWNLDKDNIEELFKVKIQDSAKEFTVKDLEKIESFDAFENLKMEFTGTAPDGFAEWEASGIMDGSKGFYFSVSPQEGLSNGDKVTVKVEPEEYLDKIIQKTGKAPKETEKVYTVEGLLSYIQSGAQVDDTLLNSMKKEVEDLITSDIAREGETVELVSAEYQGYYFLTAKDSFTYKHNVFYPVYKVNIRINLPENNFVQDYSYFVTGGFENIMDEGNGKVSVDVNDMNTIYNSFVIDTGVGTWFTTKYYLDGFETLDSLRTTVVSKNLSNYKAEEKILSNESTTETEASTETSTAEESTEAETTTNS